jgi:hypothetical protein
MTIEELFLAFRAQDPNFAKVDNKEPAREFAFEIPGDLTVEAVAAFTDSQAHECITAVDDYDVTVERVPLGETSRVLYFQFCGRTVNLPIKDESPTVALFVHVIALLLVKRICENPELFDLSITTADVCKLRFWRFFYDSTDGWWDVTLDDPSEPTTTAEQDADGNPH